MKDGRGRSGRINVIESTKVEAIRRQIMYDEGGPVLRKINGFERKCQGYSE